jgi:hypothetical protein
MLNIAFYPKQRQGSVAVFVSLIIVLAFAIATTFYLGAGAADREAFHLEKGYNAFTTNNFAQAYESFIEAQHINSPWLDFYRLFVAQPLTADELTDMTFSLCITAAYEDFFNLEPASDWVVLAQKEASKFSEDLDPEAKEEVAQSLKTLEKVSEICKMYHEEDYENAFRQLLVAENEASEDNLDFFLFEIRFMIASARAMTEPLIIKRARELLFIMTNRIGDDNEKTMALWSLLRSGSN